MTSSEASSPASLLASTDTEESSQRGEIKDDEDGDDKESDFLGGIRNGSWYVTWILAWIIVLYYIAESLLSYLT